MQISNHVIAKRKRKSKLLSTLQSYKKNYQLMIMFLPVVIALIAFRYVPMYGMIIAFKEYNILEGIVGSEWVGLLQFEKIFKIASFKEVFRNTITISFLRIILGFPAPIILSLLLNEVMHMRFKKVVQTISYLPHFLSWVVLGGLFKQILSPSSGIVNQLIVFLGGEPIYFLANSKYFVGTLIITGIWQTVGWGTIVYLAAITSINPQLYEAAIMDGAGRFRRIWNITLPSITPVISIVFILGIGNIVNAGFDQIFNLYNVAVYNVADIIDTYVYRKGLLELKYSYTAAVGLFKNVISFSMVMVTNIVIKKINNYGIW